MAEHERFVKTITDGLPVVISYWSVDSRCLFANKAYLERVGKPEQEVIGKLRYGSLEDAFASLTGKLDFADAAQRAMARALFFAGAVAALNLIENGADRAALRRDCLKIGAEFVGGAVRR